MIFLDEIQTTEQLVQAFHAWLETFDAVDDENRLLDWMSRCLAPLPGDLRRDFDLPLGSTYATAAELFLSLWVDVSDAEAIKGSLPIAKSSTEHYDD